MEIMSDQALLHQLLRVQILIGWHKSRVVH